jgi:hypothetical protein
LAAHIQIPFYLVDSMTNYIATAKQTNDFPEYSEQCPLCGGKDCAVRIGFYFRKQVVFKFKIYKNVPIARWLCRKKGHLKTKQRTFSLLPSVVIPYHSHDLNLILETVKHKRQQQGATFEHIKSFISDRGIKTDIALENNQIHDFLQIFTSAFAKLMAIPQLKQHIEQADFLDSSDPIITLISFINSYKSRFLTTANLKVSKIEKLTFDLFFNFQTACFFDRHFLFGTPSQKRL